MTKLTRTDVDHSTIGEMEIVSFQTDAGQIKLTRFDDGETSFEIGFDDVDADEMADLLNDVADDEHMDPEALEAAFGMVDAAGDETEESADEDNADEDNADEDNGEQADTGAVVHTLDDGTEVRIGDRINHRDGSAYKVAGRASEHTISKTDLSDASEITIRTLEKDIRERGFSERVDV